jgi:Tfp pilus assembly protein PilV
MEIPRLWLRNRSDAHALDDGFGMIEVVISMFLLSLLSVSFIPLLVNSIRNTGKNATIATATQIVNQEIEGARAVRSPTSTTPSCLDVTNFLNVTLASVTLLPKWDPATCPTGYPGVVRARISVTRSGSSNIMAQAVTLIYVASAS